MAYSEFLADRIRAFFKSSGRRTEERKMMGGLCFMVEDKMCVGVVGDSLMARIGPDRYEAALGKRGCRPMDFTGKAMKGFVFVDPEAIDTDTDLSYWLGVCLEFNPQARSSRKQ